MARAVLFDVDGVLVHGFHARPELQRRWDENLLADLGVDPEQFAEKFIHDVFVKKVIVGRMGLIDALDRVLPQLGYRGSPLRFASYWLEHDSHLDTDLVKVARQLKASGTKLYIATNQEHLRAQWLWQGLKLGEVFDDMFHSARIGIAKPQAGYFDEVTRRIGKQDEAPLFFDDRADIVAAARRAGWEAVLYETLEDCTNHPWVATHIG